jgi:hypothetical protein
MSKSNKKKYDEEVKEAEYEYHPRANPLPEAWAAKKEAPPPRAIPKPVDNIANLILAQLPPLTKVGRLHLVQVVKKIPAAFPTLYLRQN